MSATTLMIEKFTNNKIKIYGLGLLFALGITFLEAIRSTYTNFQIYSFGSLDFWAGSNPYRVWEHTSLLGNPLDDFLYSPQFSMFFTPFALLPGWIGLFIWNIFTYTLFYFSVFTLPHQFSFAKKKFIFLYSGLLLLQTLFAEQFNPVVAALFLFSFTLLEKEKGIWAVLLILLSGFTKVYGIFQIGMILFYPKFWKHALYALLFGIILLALPLVKMPVNVLIDYYDSWLKVLMLHSEDVRFYVIYRPIHVYWKAIAPIMGIISFIIVTAIYLFALIKLKIFKESIYFRTQFLGILLSWAILFGTSSEKNTYLIAVAGYVLWYICVQTTKSDQILLWINFVLLSIMPIDILCPTFISDFLLNTLNLGIFIFAVTWGIMVYKTFSSCFKPVGSPVPNIEF